MRWIDLRLQQNFVDGAWVDALSGKTSSVDDPATGELLGQVPNGGREDAARAIAAAKKGFPTWKALTAEQRAAYLRKLHGLILEHNEPLAELLTREQGKPLAEARAEIGMSAAYVLWAAEEARRVYGDVIPSPWADRRILVTREPVGVVAAITPWNFPSSMLARKIAPALAAGCTVVAKPAPDTPYSGIAWGWLAEQAGLPAGVLNVITGSAEEIGEQFTTHPDVAKITFTGSTRVGRILLQQAASTVKRTSMELGGNAPFLVFEDADLERAVEGAMAAKFRNSGQTCVCANRFYVQSGIYDAFVEAFAKAAAAQKIGAGLEEGVVQGPLITDAAVQNVQAMVDDSVAHGARVVTGGNRVGETRFFQPTVLADATQSMRCACEEIFGPVAPVFRFETEEEAIAMANDTEFGLAGFFYTRDLARAFRAAERLQCGMVGINEGLITTEVAPFGGVKQSGLGREGSKYGLEDYTQLKYVCIGGMNA